MLYRFTLDDKDYTITYSGNYFILQDDTTPAGQPCKKVIFVEDIPGYTFKILKTKFKANGGARGLFSFVVDCYKNNFMTIYADRIIRAAAAMKA